MHLIRNIVAVPKGSWVIQGFCGAQADVEAYGDIVYEATVNGQKRVDILRLVLYAPNTGINLVSVGQITALGISVNFSGTIFEFVRNNKVEVTGRRTGSTLYRLDIKALVERPQQERVLVAKQSAASLMTWHRRLSHVNCKTIQQMEASNAVEGVKITDRKLPAICEGCIYGKMCRRSFKCSNKDPKALEIGQLIISDVGGPMQEKSLSGALYYLAIKDKASGFRQVFFLKKKSEVAGKFKIYIPSFQNETGKLIKAIRTDNGTEFKGQDWTWVDEMGIKRQYTIPFTPQQNGASERDNRTIVEAARSALYGRKHLVSSLVLLRGSGQRRSTTPYIHLTGLSPAPEMLQRSKDFTVRNLISHTYANLALHVVSIKQIKNAKNWKRKGRKACFSATTITQPDTVFSS
jgi:hypothetical protein